MAGERTPASTPQPRYCDLTTSGVSLPMISTAGPGVSGAGAASAQVAGKLGSLEECAGCHKKIHDK